MPDSAATVVHESPLAWQDARYLIILWFLALPLVAHALGISGWLSLASLVAVALGDFALGNHPAASLPRPWPAPRRTWFRALLLGYVPLQLALLAWALMRVAQAPGWGKVVLIGIGAGFVTGAFGITIAHELGHRKSRFDRFVAQLLLVMVCYGHFYVEHNRGHHARVGTRDDAATARFGESFWAFWPRTVRGNFTHAWKLEAMRLEAAGGSAFSLANRNLIYLVIEVALLALCFAVAGAKGAVFFAVQSLVALTLLELINYVEHYGLTRQVDAYGRAEPVGPQHSWNSDAWFSNALLINLQRHSDHHADSSRPYETLRSIDAAPQLPTGYAGMILLALVPPLWFRVMNPRVRCASAPTSLMP